MLMERNSLQKYILIIMVDYGKILFAWLHFLKSVLYVNHHSLKHRLQVAKNGFQFQNFYSTQKRP